MRVAICNVPIRGKPTDVPPYGMMYIRQALLEIDCQVDFYNFDFHRPPDEKINSIFTDNKYDIVGISAVVSTAYEFTKKIARLAKNANQQTQIVLGGNLAANSEVILRYTEVDYCVIGDGEETIKELVKFFRTTSQLGVEKNSSLGSEKLSTIKGICYLDYKKDYIFTGYRDKLAAADIDWPDYSVLESDGSLDHYFPSAEQWFLDNDLEVPSSVKGKRSSWLPVARGCISRCTFCHRFEKGYRARPTDQVSDHVRMLREKYNVGLVMMFDESWGADRKSALEIAKNLWELGIYWGAGSVRAKTLDEEIVGQWYANGCRMITCGLESGSQDMLNIMEKKGSVEDNIRALKAIHKFGLSTNVMLVLGMPGETDGTIDETINFLKQALPYYMNEDRGAIEEVAAFYAQALPGTPLYETYREKGLIGLSIADEEKYLDAITNVDALNIRHFLNGTDMPMIVVLSWRDKIFWSVYKYYFENILGVNIALSLIFKEGKYRLWKRRKGQNIDQASPLVELFESIRTVDMKNTAWASAKIPMIYLLTLNNLTKPIGVALIVLRAVLRKSKDPLVISSYVAEYILWFLKGSPGKNMTGHGISLRKTVSTIVPIDGSIQAIEIRKGR